MAKTAEEYHQPRPGVLARRKPRAARAVTDSALARVAVELEVAERQRERARSGRSPSVPIGSGR